MGYDLWNARNSAVSNLMKLIRLASVFTNVTNSLFYLITITYKRHCVYRLQNGYDLCQRYATIKHNLMIKVDEVDKVFSFW